MLAGFCVSWLMPTHTRAAAPTDSVAMHRWADSVMKTMTVSEKIGQLFMLDAFSAPEKLNKADIECLIKECHIGGLIFFKGSPYAQAQLTNYYQSISTVPLLIGMDAEWGLSMRLDSTPSFAKQMAMGALYSDSLIYAFGKEMAMECKRIGVHFSFSPVADVNNNPLNPVINDRSFGEDKYLVTSKSLHYMKGLQDNGILACAKHFPGHGDVHTDSHLDLPEINKSYDALYETELFPFRQLFEQGVSSIMAAHLHIPALDSTEHSASSISKNVVTGLLRDSMHFNGLAITDALNMKGVAKYFFPADLNLRAFMAGADILLYAEEVPSTIDHFIAALLEGKITEAQLNDRVHRILCAKYFAGLNHYQPIDLNHLTEDLNSDASRVIRMQMARQSLVLVRNQHDVIPLTPSPKTRLLSIAIGTGDTTVFQQKMMAYNPMTILAISKNASDSLFQRLLDTLDDFDQVIVSVHQTSRFLNKKYGLTPQTVRFVNQLPGRRSILVYFGNAYALDSLSSVPQLLQAWEDNTYFQTAAAAALFGGFSLTGHLPVTPNPDLPSGSGIQTQPTGALTWSIPEEMGLNPLVLGQIDSLVQEGLRQHAMPGCQVLVSRYGKVVYAKAFGHMGSCDSTPVTLSARYDVASMTKILSTTLAAMVLYDEGKLDLDRRVSYYLKEFRKSNKKDITIRQLLLHEAGLTAFIPFFQELKKTSQYDSLFHHEPDARHKHRIADSLFALNELPHWVWTQVIASPVNAPGKYVYSDLSFLILQKVIEKISGHRLDYFVNEHIYQPMHLNRMGYLPTEKPLTDRSDLVPTERDTVYGRGYIRGYVHDPSALLWGGVAGNAGLFSNAWDVATLMHMLLDSGRYGSRQLIKPSTVTLFTARGSQTSRRGLGFDKPEPNPEMLGPVTPLASMYTFGHQGFTGTCTWADPKYGLVYVFLSNRVDPTAGNKVFGELNLRVKALEAVYRAMEKK